MKNKIKPSLKVEKKTTKEIYNKVNRIISVFLWYLFFSFVLQAQVVALAKVYVDICLVTYARTVTVQVVVLVYIYVFMCVYCNLPS